VRPAGELQLCAGAKKPEFLQQLQRLSEGKNSVAARRLAASGSIAAVIVPPEQTWNESST
jgi:hypothetical protein